MRLSHLALNVRDAGRSAAFYTDVIGLSAEVVEEPWGRRLRLDGGLMFALIDGEPLPADVVDRVHFGCHLPDPESVHAARSRLRVAGAEEVEWWEEDGYVSVKVRDPDGYVVELAYDVQ